MKTVTRRAIAESTASQFSTWLRRPELSLAVSMFKSSTCKRLGTKCDLQRLLREIPPRVRPCWRRIAVRRRSAVRNLVGAGVLMLDLLGRFNGRQGTAGGKSFGGPGRRDVAGGACARLDLFSVTKPMSPL